jgi:hypothetical protein
MLEGRITKAVVVQDHKGQTVLMGVAEYYDAKVNFMVPFEWGNLDYEWFVKELRETLARDLDLPVNRMDVNERRVLQTMHEGALWYAERSRIIQPAGLLH